MTQHHADGQPRSRKDNTSYTLGATTIPGVSASAARAKDGKLYLALVNTDPSQAVEVAVNVAGTKVKAAAGKVLTAAAMDAHNTFQYPQAIKQGACQGRDGGRFRGRRQPGRSAAIGAK